MYRTYSVLAARITDATTPRHQAEQQRTPQTSSASGAGAGILKPLCRNDAIARYTHPGGPTQTAEY